MSFLGKREENNSKSGSKKSEGFDVFIGKKTKTALNRSSSSSRSFGEISAKINSPSVKKYRSVEEIIELDKKIVQIQRSTRTTFKAMVPTHDFLRMKYGWYNRWHQTRISNPTHCLALVTAVAVVVFFFVANQKQDGRRYSQAADPITFTSDNALYSGDFEGVNGVVGLNQGWKSDETTRSDNTDFGWNRTNFTRDTHGGDLAYVSTTDSATYATQYRTMEFNLASEEFTLSGWMKANAQVVDNNGGIVMNYSKAGATNFYEVKIIPGKGGVAPFAAADTWQYFTTTATFAADALGANFQIALNGPNWSGATNAAGAAITFDDLSLTFTNHTPITLYALTADPLGPVYGAVTTIACPAP